MPDILQIAIARKTKLIAELQELERFIRIGETLSKDIKTIQDDMEPVAPMSLGAEHKADEDGDKNDGVERISA